LTAGEEDRLEAERFRMQAEPRRWEYDLAGAMGAASGMAHRHLNRVVLAITLSAALHALLLLNMTHRAAGVEGATSDGVSAGMVNRAANEFSVSLKTSPPRANVREGGQPDASLPSKSTGAEMPIRQPALEINSAQRLYYYAPDEVDRRAAPRELVSRPFPGSFLPDPSRIVTVRLRLYISDTGSIDGVEVVQASGPFASAALDDFLQSQFTPALRHGQPVMSRQLAEVSFLR
jgi:hypothetical protein